MHANPVANDQESQVTQRLPRADVFRRPREQVLRAQSGPVSTEPPMPSCLRGLVADDDNASDDNADDDEGDDA